MLRFRAPRDKACQSLPPRPGFLWAVLWAFLRAVLCGAHSPRRQWWNQPSWPARRPAASRWPSGPEDRANHLAGL